MANFTISLKAARINAGFTQSEAASKIGASESALAGWEQGKHKVSHDNVVLLARLYNCPIDLIRMPDSSQ